MWVWGEKLCGSPYFSCVPIESVLRVQGVAGFQEYKLSGSLLVIRGVFSRGIDRGI